MLFSALPRSLSRYTLFQTRRVGGKSARRVTSTTTFERYVVSSKSEVDIVDSHNVHPDVEAPVSKTDPNCIINSHTEWDPLEEIIVGRVDGATIPEWHVSGKAVWPKKHWDMYKNQAGHLFPRELVQKASEELDHFSRVLELEGVTVRRPEIRPGDFGRPVSTPDFESKTQLYAAMPRDVLIVIGNEIIEAPMAWRSRFFEYRPFRSLVKHYFQQGGGWTAAPKPEMSDALYIPEEKWEHETYHFVTTEHEPVFDAAEFTRMGRDIFCQRSQVTNRFGIEWLQRHIGSEYQSHPKYLLYGLCRSQVTNRFGIEWLQRHIGSEYQIHVLDFEDKNAMHIDGTFVPLGPGKILVNPKRPCITGNRKTFFTYDGQKKTYTLPDMFKGWDIFVAESPTLPDTHPLYFTSSWTASCNVLLLDETRVVCEASEKPTIRAFESWGFEVIKVPFRHFLPFGGSFHCATCDIRRRGTLQSYF